MQQEDIASIEETIQSGEKASLHPNSKDINTKNNIVNDNNSIEKSKKQKQKAEEKQNIKAEKQNRKAEQQNRKAAEKQNRKNRTQKQNKSYTKSNAYRWDKLDNTANLFPVIASDDTTNVYRISVTLTEEIVPELLQEAVEKILPYFDMFQYRLKAGFFWYYFEPNQNPYPLIKEESTFPCRYINAYENNEYLFRVSYYKKRINLEVFHVLTDGSGAMNFIRELTCQYLRLSHPEIVGKVGNHLNENTSLNIEDSYTKNYKKGARKNYVAPAAVKIKGPKFPSEYMGIMHGYVPLPAIKEVAKKYQVTLNQYLIGVYVWAIYKNYLNGMPNKKPIVVSVPVDLRPYFDSDTTKNFFVMTNATFRVEKEDYTFEEVLKIVTDDLKRQINKDNLEKLLSYNVSNQKNLILRSVPLFVKKIAIWYVFVKSAKASTTTITNVGQIKLKEEYEKYVERFHVFISMSLGQNLKGAVVSYNGTMVFTFSSNLRDTAIQKGFFRKLTADGLDVTLETNGVYYE